MPFSFFFRFLLFSFYSLLHILYYHDEQEREELKMNSYMPEGMLENGAFTPRDLERAMEKRKILEAPVTLCDGEMNLHVALGKGLLGIIPYREAVYTPNEDPIKDIAVLTRVGKTVAFRVMSVERQKDGHPLYILSRREAQRECYENKISLLRPGDVIPAKITHMEAFGAFADIGCGIVSLLSVDSASVSRITHPHFRFFLGEEIRVVVKAKDDSGRIFISHKELLGTWEENAALFKVGQTVTGIARSREPYGVFVELTPNLTGLAEPRESIAENSAVAVYIKSILKEKMKIKLVIIDTYPAKPQKILLPPFPSSHNITHIDRWTYSPRGAEKHIESIFS